MRNASKTALLLVSLYKARTMYVYSGSQTDGLKLITTVTSVDKEQGCSLEKTQDHW